MALPTIFIWLVQSRCWFPLQALAFRGRAGASSARLRGLPCHAFPAGVSYLPFQSTLCFKRRNCWLVLFQTLFKTSLSFIFFLLYSLMDGRNLRHSCRITGLPRSHRRLRRGGLADSRRKGSGFRESTEIKFKKNRSLGSSRTKFKTRWSLSFFYINP